MERRFEFSSNLTGISLVAIDGSGKKRYGFKLKGGTYGDLHKVQREESSRRGYKQPYTFEQTQKDYDGY